MSTRPLDLGGHSSLRIDFSFHAVGMENDEDFFVEVFDGTQWVVVGHFARGADFDNGTSYTRQLNVSSSQVALVDGGKVRFRADGSGDDDRVYIDDVVITAH